MQPNRWLTHDKFCLILIDRFRYSLEKIARLADLSLNTIVKIENGVNQNPTIETLTKIAKALDVGVDDLLK